MWEKQELVMNEPSQNLIESEKAKMPPICFLIKPVSSNCNLRCRYCFYLSEAESRQTASYGIMREDTLETIVRKALEYADGACCFMFQGGEPTLAGFDFFQYLIKIERRYNRKRILISNSIQTNGMLVDEDWAQFFHDNDFLVGLSLDGPGEIHNLHRVGTNGQDTFGRVMKTARLFDRYRVKYNILAVVTSNSTRYVNRIYDFFKKNGWRYLQFIPCLDPVGEKPGGRAYSLKPAELEKFLKQLFDRWYNDFMQGKYVSIRYFDNLLSMLQGKEPEACNMAGHCSCNCVVEADGGVYPCDFYVLDHWYLGNIQKMEISDMTGSDTAKEFIQSSLTVPFECGECKWRGLCRGGCRRERERFSGENLGTNMFCSAYRGFFDYAYNRLLKAAKLV
jgi:uncharacterized protein